MVDQNTMGAPEVNREFDIFQAFVCIDSKVDKYWTRFKTDVNPRTWISV